MKVPLLALTLLLLGAAQPVEEVPVGHFISWGGPGRPALRFRSGGVEVSIAALSCPAKPVRDDGCAGDGINNQASITVAAPGLRPFTMVSDANADIVSVAVGRLDRRAARSGVIIDNEWAGTLGTKTVVEVEPVAGGFHAVQLRDGAGGEEIAGEISDFPRDVNGDGLVDFVMEDVGFAYTFGCGACTPRPPVILSIVGDRSVDLSTDPTTRSVFARDLIRVRALCRSRQDYRNGNCAAYVADAARIGRFREAWRDMLMHFEPGERGGDLWADCADKPRPAPCYRTFPASLRGFLVHAGYVTPAQAAVAPLS